MKNFSWKRKLAGALAAVGLLTPGAALAADLNTNLVVNPSFEGVVEAEPGLFTSVRLLDWVDADGDDDDTFSYPYSSAYSGDPAPPGAGEWHFTGGFNTSADEVQVLQAISVSGGDSGALIATGGAAYNLSGYFSSYRGQDDSSSIRARFLSGGGGELGVAEIGGLDFIQSVSFSGDQRDWGQDATAGLIPAATASVAIEIVASDGDVNHDGYVDFIDFQITDELTLPALDLEIDRGTGGIRLNNRTGGPLHFSGYSILSAVGALDPANWSSVAGNYDADNDRSVDANNVWTELSNSAANSDLSEGDLDTGSGTILANNQSILLSSADGWIRYPVEDLVFEYASDGEVTQGLISYVGNGGNPFEFGDLDVDGDIDVDDWSVLRTGQHKDLSQLSELAAYTQGDLTGDGLNNHTDFVTFQILFDEANGVAAFAAMAAGVPEPASVLLVAWGALFAWGTVRRSDNTQLG